MKKCFYCKQKIIIGQKAALIETFIEGNKKEKIEKVSMHFDCYTKWFDECVAKSIISSTNTALKQFEDLVRSI